MKKNNFKSLIKEFVFIPILMLTLFLLILKLKIFNNEFLTLNYFCSIFLSFIILILLETFLMFDVPKNLIFSRLVGVSFSLLSYYIFSVSLSNKLYPLILIVISIIIGQIANYIFQKFVAFRRSEMVSLILIVIMSIVLTFFEFFG